MYSLILFQFPFCHFSHAWYVLRIKYRTEEQTLKIEIFEYTSYKIIPGTRNHHVITICILYRDLVIYRISFFLIYHHNIMLYGNAFMLSFNLHFRTINKKYYFKILNYIFMSLLYILDFHFSFIIKDS